MPINKLSFLELTNFPVTNQELELFKKSGWFRRNASKSHFYMICSRPKVTIRYVPDERLKAINNMERFEVISGESLKDQFLLNPEEVPEIKNLPLGEPYRFVGEGQILFLSKPHDIEKNSDVYRDWTIQKILWERSREEPWILGLNKFRDFLTYELLYVGIAPSTNTLSRLIENGHHARQKILSNEFPKEYGTRVTDEVHVLMFEINPLFIQDMDDSEDLSKIFVDGYEESPIIKDAEKAFINLLNPKYNKEKYAKYPHGNDGVYNTGLAGYSYTIAENIVLNTPNGPFTGARSTAGILFSEGADNIVIKGDHVEIKYAEKVA